MDHEGHGAEALAPELAVAHLAPEAVGVPVAIRRAEALLRREVDPLPTACAFRQGSFVVLLARQLRLAAALDHSLVGRLGCVWGGGVDES